MKSLVIRDTRGSGETTTRTLGFRLPALLSFGRVAGNDVILDVDVCAKQQARLLREGDDVILEELGNNGVVFVNGKRVHRVLLKPEDRVVVVSWALSVVDGDLGEPVLPIVLK